ncbi:maleylacetate reductase [Acidisoma cellulosilytica]|uniref:Maleylacetate reductase n=1 Tax=Acidisoma cellulosilyticum TaxID=2802395 RepID=A0A963Z4B2_9PROT|nr:maleylacetate reductase [Acidisoma cellulosilyticum]MCB8881498.1 maleylacetate reductase [Acidisoma cellulosilyticum]
MRVVFGDGTLAQLPEEAERLGMGRILVLSTPEQKDQAADIAARLGTLAVGLFDRATMHTPVDITEQALAVVQSLNVDGVVSVGGGSTTGLGKAIALRTDLPQIAVPTTYAGSEMTPILGETKNGEKITLRTPKVLPETTIYDVSLTLSLPPAISATSGMNAIAHAVEALYAEERNPIISLMAEEAIKALAKALPIIVADPHDRDARHQALYGAWLCGIALGSVGMALHHKLCHVLGGSFNLPHAPTHTVVLPHAVAYNAAGAPEAMRRIASALGAENAAQGLYDLSRRLGAPLSLAEIGMREADIEQAVTQAAARPYPNPRPLETAALRRLLQNAFAGKPPQEEQA